MRRRRPRDVREKRLVCYCTLFDSYYYFIELYTQKPRAYHSSPVIGDSVFVWAGNQPDLPRVHDSTQKRQFTSTIDILSLTSGQWTTQLTRGTPPLGVRGYSCTVINSNIYYFGGWCGHDDCYHNTLSCLDTLTLKWSHLPTDETVMKRAYGGMTSIQFSSGQQYLLTVGGCGFPSYCTCTSSSLSVCTDILTGIVRTNETNLFNVSTGKCYCVTCIF